MIYYQGFSLIEILIGLLLVTSTSLALLRQHWQLSQLINQTLMTSHALTQLDNNSERLMAKQFLNKTTFPFRLTHRASHQTQNLQLTWDTISLNHQPCCTLKRSIVVLR